MYRVRNVRCCKVQAVRREVVEDGSSALALLADLVEQYVQGVMRGEGVVLEYDHVVEVAQYGHGKTGVEERPDESGPSLKLEPEVV
jgi:hypothetical protein